MMDQRSALAGRCKRKRSPEGCQSATQERNKIPKIETPARKTRNRKTTQLKQKTHKEKKGTDPETFASHYAVGEQLGQGGSGSVFKGRRLSDGLQVAVKIVTKQKSHSCFQSPDGTKTVPVEVALMQMVNQPPTCPNIIQLIEWFDEPNRYILVLELPDNCRDLFSYLDLFGGSVNEDIARKIMLQAVQAASECLKRGVLHRDIKLQNLLINMDTSEVKLIDFGCGDKINEAGYVCSEEDPLKRKYQASPATAWALGILLFRMVCGCPPFTGMPLCSIPLKPGLSTGKISGRILENRKIFKLCLKLLSKYRCTKTKSRVYS